MATILKHRNTLSEQVVAIERKIFEEKKRSNEVNQQYKREAIGNAILWCLILSVAFFFIFPISSVVGWFLGYHIFVKCKKSKHERIISDLRRKQEKLSKGNKGEVIVSNLLAINTSSDYLLLNDITIPTRNRRSTQIDHILICPNGNIICIEAKNITGNYYPHKDGWKWFPNESYVSSNKTHVIKSPQRQSMYHAEQLKWLLQTKGIKKSVHAVVVLTSSSAHWNGSHRNCPVLKPNEVVSFIKNHFKGKEKTEEELESIAQAILKEN